MISSKKPFVSKEQTFDILEIRVGRILSIESAADVPKPAYVMTAHGQDKGPVNAPGRKLVLFDPIKRLHRSMCGVGYATPEISSQVSRL